VARDTLSSPIEGVILFFFLSILFHSEPLILKFVFGFVDAKLTTSDRGCAYPHTHTPLEHVSEWLRFLSLDTFSRGSVSFHVFLVFTQSTHQSALEHEGRKAAPSGGEAALLARRQENRGDGGRVPDAFERTLTRPSVQRFGVENQKLELERMDSLHKLEKEKSAAPSESRKEAEDASTVLDLSNVVHEVSSPEVLRRQRQKSEQLQFEENFLSVFFFKE